MPLPLNNACNDNSVVKSIVLKPIEATVDSQTREDF